MEAKSVPYLTVATLTSVAFLRSSRIRKLPAEEERHVCGAQQQRCKAFELNPAGDLPTNILTNRQVGVVAGCAFNGPYNAQLHM